MTGTVTHGTTEELLETVSYRDPADCSIQSWQNAKFLRQENQTRSASRFRPCPSTVQSIYNDTAAAPGTHLAFFADDTCIYAAEKHERRVLCKLQRVLTAVNQWCESWNIKIVEGRFHEIRFSDDEVQLLVNERHIPFVNKCNMLVSHSTADDTKNHIERTVVMTLRAYM